MTVDAIFGAYASDGARECHGAEKRANVHDRFKGCNRELLEKSEDIEKSRVIQSCVIW